MKHKDSTLKRMDCQMSVVHDGTNKPYACIVQVKDLSTQSEMERKLAESEQRYKSLIEHNPAGILTCDIKWPDSTCESRYGAHFGVFRGRIDMSVHPPYIPIGRTTER